MIKQVLVQCAILGKITIGYIFVSSPQEVWEMGLGPGVELHQHQVGHVEALDEEDLCPGHPFWLDGYLRSMTMETPMG